MVYRQLVFTSYLFANDYVVSTYQEFSKIINITGYYFSWLIHYLGINKLHDDSNGGPSLALLFTVINRKAVSFVAIII